jgi:hypothetical protein
MVGSTAFSRRNLKFFAPFDFLREGDSERSIGLDRGFCLVFASKLFRLYNAVKLQILLVGSQPYPWVPQRSKRIL